MINDIALCHYLSRDSVDMAEVAARIKGGANPNTRNWNKDSVLHLAVNARNTEYIQAALAIGVDVHITNGEGHSALYCLLNQSPCNLEAALLLIKHGASCNTMNQNGDSFLHLAIRSGNLDFIHGALSSGVNRHNTNHLRQSPLLFLLQQNPCNLEAVALVLLASCLDQQGDAPLHWLKVQKPGHCLDRKGLAHLAKQGDNKERVIRYIASLPAEMQRILIPHCLNGHQALGAFFYTRRWFLPPTLSSGSLAVLLDMQRQLPAFDPPSQPVVVHPWNAGAAASAPPLSALDISFFSSSSSPLTYHVAGEPVKFEANKGRLPW